MNTSSVYDVESRQPGQPVAEKPPQHFRHFPVGSCWHMHNGEHQDTFYPFLSPNFRRIFTFSLETPYPATLAESSPSSFCLKSCNIRVGTVVFPLMLVGCACTRSLHWCQNLYRRAIDQTQSRTGRTGRTGLPNDSSLDDSYDSYAVEFSNDFR